MALVPSRFETAANWASSNPVLANNEVGIETDTGFVKTGDGVRAWASLPKTDDQETSAFRAAKTSDETGTGAVVLATSPTLVTPTLTTPTMTTPVLGAATATTVNKVTITAPTTSATLTLVTGSSLITAGAYAITLTSTATTGVTLPTSGTLATLAGSEALTNKTLTSPTVAWSVATPAASATQTQGGGTAITAAINRVSTVASADDALTLPAATAGKVIKVKNAHATNQIGIFPAVGETINALSPDAVYALPALKMVEFNCVSAGTWDTILTA